MVSRLSSLILISNKDGKSFLVELISLDVMTECTLLSR